MLTSADRLPAGTHRDAVLPTSTASSSMPRTAPRFVDPDDLICPGCGEQAIGVPPAYWQVRDGLPVPGFSHPDRTAMCRTAAGRIVEPVEVAR